MGARLFALGRNPDGPASDAGEVGTRLLVEGGAYDVRHIVADPHAVHGPGRYGGDACVCVLAGSVQFTVDERVYDLHTHDVLWVPAGALRAFRSGSDGARLLAVHLPAGANGEPPPA